MLTIKDLTASKELDSKALAGVRGGMPLIDASLFSIAKTKNADLLNLNANSIGGQYNEQTAFDLNSQNGGDGAVQINHNPKFQLGVNAAAFIGNGNPVIAQ